MEYAKTDIQSGYFPPVGGEIEEQYRRLSNRYGYLISSGAEAVEISKTLEEMNKLINQAEHIWLESVGADEQAILRKTRATVNAISKEEVSAFITKERESLQSRLAKRIESEHEAQRNGNQKKADLLRELNAGDEHLLSTIFSLSFDGAWAYLATRTFWLRRALEHYEIPLDGYNALLDERAAEYAFPQKRKRRASRSDEQALMDYNARINAADQLMIPGFFDEPYKKMLQGAPNTMLATVSARGATPDKLTGDWSLKMGDKEMVISNFSQLTDSLGVSANKIFSAACIHLAASNPYRPAPGAKVENVVTISLDDYAKANGIDLSRQHCDTVEEMEKDAARIRDKKRDLKDLIRKDLSTLERMQLSWHDPRKSGDYSHVRVISGSGIRGNTIRINFDTDMANALVNAYITHLPTALFRHDNRNPNAFAIGYKIAVHHSMDANIQRGTDTRLSVKSLLEAAPQIVKYEDLIASGNRNWKRNIKTRLEKALDDNVAEPVGYLSRWAYYQGDQELTREQAGKLDYESYTKLMVDFAVELEIPDQTDRLAAKAERIEKKKRGRPKKK